MSGIRPLLIAGCALGAAAPAAGQDPEDSRLQVHGYLSQAYARSDLHQVLGISRAGTFDYRTVALLVRYSFAAQDHFVIQFENERFGDSQVNESNEGVEVDVAYVEHRWSPRASIQVGRIKMPSGIYNEIRDVGTLLPLYRPPQTVYGDLTYTTEYLDGMAVRHAFGGDGAWGLEATVYVGQWSFVQPPDFSEARNRNGLGAQLWLQTPLEGVRVGLGARRQDVYDLAGVAPGYVDHSKQVTASLDLTRARWMLRAEVERLWFRSEADGTITRSYAQVGYNVAARLTLVAQAEVMHFHLTLPPPVSMRADADMIRDGALGLRYAFTPTLMLKLEGHHFRGYNVENISLSPFGDAPVTTTYGLLSFAASF